MPLYTIDVEVRAKLQIEVEADEPGAALLKAHNLDDDIDMQICDQLDDLSYSKYDFIFRTIKPKV